VRLLPLSHIYTLKPGANWEENAGFELATLFPRQLLRSLTAVGNSSHHAAGEAAPAALAGRWGEEGKPTASRGRARSITEHRGTGGNTTIPPRPVPGDSPHPPGSFQGSEKNPP